MHSPTHRFRPEPDEQNIVKVVAGWGHSAALTMDGQLYVCGRNYQGQLGLGSPQGFPQNERGHPFQADFCLIEKLQHLKIRQIACGGEHSVAVSESGEVGGGGGGLGWVGLGFAGLGGEGGMVRGGQGSVLCSERKAGPREEVAKEGGRRSWGLRRWFLPEVAFVCFSQPPFLPPSFFPSIPCPSLPPFLPSLPPTPPTRFPSHPRLPWSGPPSGAL